MRSKSESEFLATVPMEDRIFSIEGASAVLDQCRAQTYKDIRAGLLKTVKNGKRRKIPGMELKRRVREITASAA